MPNSASLFEMVDLALGTPEVGCVNYTVLHRFLHAIIHQLQIGNIQADLPDEDEKAFLTTTTTATTSHPKDRQRRHGKSDVGLIGETEHEDMLKEKMDLERDRDRGMAAGAYQFSDADSGVTGVTYGMESADVSGSSGPEKEESRSIPITRTPYHQLAEKVERLERLLQELEALPSNRELWERAGGDGADRQGDGKPRPVAEMWQSMQLSRKVDANTQGVSKLMSLVEDLMLELQSLKQTNNDLKDEMQKLKASDESMQNLLQLANKIKELDERVSDDVLEGFVTWSSLEDSLKGLKQEFEPINTRQNGSDFTAFQATETASAKELSASLKELDQPTEQGVFTETARESRSSLDRNRSGEPVAGQELSSDSLKDLQSRPMSRRRSRMSTPGPSAELQDLLERLGKLTDQHEQLEARVDLLEIEMAKKGDIDLLRSLAADVQLMSQSEPPAAQSNDGFSEGLNEQLRKMLEDIDAIKDQHTQDNEYLDQLRKLAETFQGDLDKLNSAVIILSEDSLKHKDQLEDLNNFSKDLDEKKADKTFVLNELNLKADKENLDGKLSSREFESACDEINQMINDILTRLLGSQGEWKSALDQLNSDIGSKLDRMEFGPYRDELERQLRALAKKITALQSAVGDGRMGPDDAAGIRKQLIQHFHCISCDRPLDMSPQKPVPSLPAAPGMPDTRTNRPYIVYELDQIRQQKRGYQWTPQYTEVVDLYATSRACGGSHTLTYPHRRIVRSSNPGPGGLYPDEAVPRQPPPPYRSDTEVGNINRGVRTASAAPGAGTSSSMSRLPNVHMMPNRPSGGKSTRTFVDSTRPQSPQPPVRPASAQLSLRPLSSRNDGLVRSKTTIMVNDDDLRNIDPSIIKDQVNEVRVPITQLLTNENVSGFHETSHRSSPLVDEAEN